MTRKQLQSLISAGIFSVALLSGAAYADDSSSAPASKSGEQAPSANQAPVVPTMKDKNSTSKTHKHSSNKKDTKHTTTTDKEAAEQGCSKASGCGGH